MRTGLHDHAPGAQYQPKQPTEAVFLCLWVCIGLPGGVIGCCLDAEIFHVKVSTFGDVNMDHEQIKEFESKLRAALRHECEVRFWREDYGHWVCYEIRDGLMNTPVPGKILASKLRSSHDVEVNVRLISNALPVSWCA